MTNIKQMADVIVKCKANSEISTKRELIAEVFTEGFADEFYKGVNLAKDNSVKFNIKPPAYDKSFKFSDSDMISADEVYKAFNDFTKRRLTGNDAANKIYEIMGKLTQHSWEGWFKRILAKKMDCGASSKIFNRVATDNNRRDLVLTNFSCQLATDIKKVKFEGNTGKDGNVDCLKGEYLVDAKLDGTRLLAFIDPLNGTVKLTSRNGLVKNNFPKLKAVLSNPSVMAIFKTPTVLDGEIMSEDFNALMRQFNRESDAKTDDCVFNVFDILSVDEFMIGEGRFTQKVRDEVLRDVITKINSPVVVYIEKEVVNFSTEEGKARFQELWDNAIGAGLEGMMIKKMDAVYECERTKSWMKIKPTISVTLQIKAVLEGQGRLANTTGSVLCEGVDEHGTFLNVQVGGFKDDERTEIWNNKDKVIDEWIEVMSDAVTKNLQGTHSLRFPRFVRFRTDANGKKM